MINEKKRGLWLNLVLFILTVFSTFIVGVNWSTSFELAEDLAELPASEIDFNIWASPKVFILSGIYAFVLLAILVGHELGHYLTCRHYRLEATLPYFIPAPTLVGTLGAFIRIRSPITKKSQLFDIGLAGPLTGFLLSVPTVVYGLANSKLVPSLPQAGTIYFGEPLFFKAVEKIILGSVSDKYDLVLHPVGVAGWVGILITAFNLFPVGQLDGGHIAYALWGARAQRLGRLVLGLFVLMGIFLWIGWLVWSGLILVLGLKHPQVADEYERLSPGRRILGWVAVAIFVLSFIPDPIKGYSLIKIILG